MSEDDHDLQNFLGTTSFGAKNVTQDLAAAYARTKRAPVLAQEEGAPHGSKSSEPQSQSLEEDSMEDDSEDEDDTGLPISHEIILDKHTRQVSGLTLDPAGTRLVSGGHDSLITFWDFAGMGAGTRAFKVLEPFDAHQIRSVDFNNTGELLLLTAANWQPKIMTREGEDVGEMPRGDPYLRDMKNTRGHVGEVTSGSWNPKNKSQCITSSADMTIRIWDAMNVGKCQQILVHKPKVAGAGKIKCTAASYSTDGKTIGGAYADGTLSLWATDGPFHRPMGGIVQDAHERGTETTGIVFSQDGWSMASRGSECVKLWDRRHFKVPIATFHGLPNRYQETNVLFSPNNQELLTSSSTGSTAHVQVMSAKTLEPLKRIPFASPPVKLLYHARLNQIVTGLVDGHIHVLYSPEKSTRGAKLVVSRAPKARHIDDLMTANIDESAGEVKLDDASLLNQSSSRARNAARKDPKKSNMPELPGTQRYAERKVVGDLTNFRDQDPQKELLKYDEAAKKDPRFFGIYNQNQPVTQFAALDDDEAKDEGSPASKRFKFTPKTSK